ncbi:MULTISPECIES: helix-turn-helix transcriptional regulator [unclassified Nocardioides]|uniref:helix-turn-helix transcriptional regulator n=1 Tax=unclassified Nocardioides TaxID=2615069 RepID=UPI000A851BBD|nr:MULTISPECIES: LuxR C-terminal-related transcriptional regulator [unclassified Nocardioides]
MNPEQLSRRNAMWDRIGRGELNNAATDALLLLHTLDSSADQAEIHSALGLMLQRVGRVAESRDRFALAAELTAHDPRLQASYVADEAGSRFLLGDLAGAASQAEHARRLGDRYANRFAACEALNTLTGIALSEGRASDGLRLSKQGVAMQAAEQESTGGGPLSHLYHGLALIELDRFADADAAFAEGMRRSVIAGSAGQLTWYHCMRALARYLSGRWDEAVGDARAGLDDADRTGTLIARPIGWAVVALVEGGRGNVTTAARLVAPREGALTAIGFPGEEWLSMARAAVAPDPGTAYDVLVEGWLHALRTPYFLGWRSLAPALVHNAVLLGHLDMARQATLHAEAGAALSGRVPSALGAALRCRALLDGDADTAVASVEAFRRSGRPFALASACLDAARLLRTSGYDDRAVTYVREAADVFHALRATPWLARAGQRLMHLPTPSPVARQVVGTPPGWLDLTATEREVARHVARGLTNPGIAAVLFISPRTVQTHTSHIYAKLRIGSRVQLTSVLRRHGLD